MALLNHVLTKFVDVYGN